MPPTEYVQHGHHTSHKRDSYTPFCRHLAGGSLGFSAHKTTQTRSEDLSLVTVGAILRGVKTVQLTLDK
jgi:hypothetical protein